MQWKHHTEKDNISLNRAYSRCCAWSRDSCYFYQWLRAIRILPDDDDEDDSDPNFGTLGD
ncbi:hypothetical protein BPOR_0223g00100 [Botrytis porri]|uniref:Uncharacterized protein n=1 Tax=Botrytis porri TaxID=87229 RepID=A0A4Z1KN00_9HELO|nr:hypothetical protein BPOR_0223g00100 [Botrytis porri]